MKEKKWRVVGKRYKNKSIIETLLHNRGLQSQKERDAFIHPVNPHDFTPVDVGVDTQQLKKAINRVQHAIKNNESIVVYSDYDADGITGSAIMWETLHNLGARVMPYVPHRVNEGYGFSVKGIDLVKQQYDPKLIISVDHGITATEKISYAKNLGIDIIVTDHHVIPDRGIPSDAYAVVHTTQLSGSGVAWFFAKELIKVFGSQSSAFSADHLGLAAFGTIADLVPLTGVNRSIAYHGLAQLSNTKRPGIVAMLAEAGISGSLSAYHVSHMLAPRINAPGRLLHALDALRLLCTKSEGKALQLAHVLGSVNRERQQLMHESSADAKSRTDGTKKLLFVADESYNQGVIGLIAGKLVEEFYRPAIVVWKGPEFSKASARSIAGFNIIKVLREAQDLLVDAGGHPMAAGFTVETKNLKALEQALLVIADKNLTDELLTPTLTIDTQLEPQEVNLALFHDIESLAPFGVGNTTPTFMLKNMKVDDVRLIGKDSSHLKFKIIQSSNAPIIQLSNPIQAIGFKMGELYSKLKSDTPIDIACTLDENTWNGTTEIQLKVKDIKIG